VLLDRVVSRRDRAGVTQRVDHFMIGSLRPGSGDLELTRFPVKQGINHLAGASLVTFEGRPWVVWGERSFGPEARLPYNGDHKIAIKAQALRCDAEAAYE